MVLLVHPNSAIPENNKNSSKIELKTNFSIESTSVSVPCSESSADSGCGSMEPELAPSPIGKPKKRTTSLASSDSVDEENLRPGSELIDEDDEEDYDEEDCCSTGRDDAEQGSFSMLMQNPTAEAPFC